MPEFADPAITDDEVRTLEAILAKLSGRGGFLPLPLFLFITRVTATANVDLLVRDEEKGVLLAWREDPFGSGWHVPGSIVRHREEVAHRISACARDEFGCEVEVDERPVALLQVFDDRGHSISLCYRTTLRGSPGKRVVSGNDTPRTGDLRWFSVLPDQIYPSHGVYRELLEALDDGRLGEGVRLFTQHAACRDTDETSVEGSIGAGPLLP